MDEDSPIPLPPFSRRWGSSYFQEIGKFVVVRTNVGKAAALQSSVAVSEAVGSLQ